MSGPETIHAEMTSGNFTTITGVETAVADVMTEVSANVALIRYAADKPDWVSPGRRTRFNMEAWTTRAAAEVSFVRLNRAELALRMVADSYRWMVEAADHVIGQWRAQKPQITSAAHLLLFRAAVMLAQRGIQQVYRDRLVEARDFVVSDPLSEQLSEWLKHGLSRSMRHDLETPINLGPIIPNTLATGDDDGWIPQGLGYDPATGLLLQASYQKVGDGFDQAQLSLVDPDTGRLINTVGLGEAIDPSGPHNVGPPDHAGGVAVHGDTVWVTSSGKPPHVYPYSMTQLREAAPGATVKPSADRQQVAAGATTTIVGNTLYVSTFAKETPGRLYTYTWDERTGSWVDERGPFPSPPQTQGIAVKGDTIVFSTSYGRHHASTLQSYPLSQVLGREGSLGEPLETVELPNMTQGVVALPDALLTTTEAGADSFSAPTGGSFESLWAQMKMTVTPYAEVGLDGHGIEVEPATLTEASSLFREAENGLETARKRIESLALPPASLGVVPGAVEFAGAVGEHLDETARWLEESRVSADITADDLVAAARDYEETDAGVGGIFGRLRDLFGES
ncbi:hypothetical protein [Nocardioides limicola]|uniref:hypothetical protein n=1 Tax=Nocardioides limicola TaxID=2803368 RepID=UPI00193BB88A|nr:hypothetical protein [Nocardioides sp. DJM-14]